MTIVNALVLKLFSIIKWFLLGKSCGPSDSTCNRIVCLNLENGFTMPL